MPICIPKEPEFRTRSERKVWHSLYDGLSADAWLFSNFVFSDDRRDFEIDMLVVDPGVGIVVIEVKGGQLTCDPSGQWLQHGAFVRTASRGSGPNSSRRHSVCVALVMRPASDHQ